MMEMRTAVIPIFIVILPCGIVYFVIDNIFGVSPAAKRVWWPILPSSLIWLLSIAIAYSAGGDPRPIDARAIALRYVMFGGIVVAVAIVVVTGCRNGRCS